MDYRAHEQPPKPEAGKHEHARAELRQKDSKMTPERSDKRFHTRKSRAEKAADGAGAVAIALSALG
jgi:hypothetical protein